MAKPKRSAADLDAELAALEAELAALEGKKKAGPKAAPAPLAPKPAPKREAESAEGAESPAHSAPSAPSASEKPAAKEKKKFGLKLPAPKKKDAPAAAASPARAPASAPAPVEPSALRPQPVAPTRSVIPDTSALATYWRREGDAWVRTVPGGARTIRRVLDEEGNVVREEPADARAADSTSNMKAERGAGKLLGRFRK